MRPHHRTHGRAALVASCVFALAAAGCDYDWEAREASDAASASDSSTEPVMTVDAGLAPDGAQAGDASEMLDAAAADAAQAPAAGDASSSLPATDAGMETPSDAASQDPMTADTSTCPAGQHTCDDRCVMNDSLQSCGQSCSPCVPPANGVSSCDGTQCGFTCMGATHACGAACASNDDVATCGTRCTSCPSVANGKAVCTNSACAITCDSNYLNCGGSCGAKSYGFEDGTLSGALREDHNSRGATTPIMSSTTRKHTGSRALSIGFSTPNTEARNITIRVPICPKGGIDLSKSFVNMYVYVDGPATIAGLLTTALASRNATGVGDPNYEIAITPNTWLHVRGPVTANWGPIEEAGLYMYAYPQGSSSWTGTVYIDDLSIE